MKKTIQTLIPLLFPYQWSIALPATNFSHPCIVALPTSIRFVKYFTERVSNFQKKCIELLNNNNNKKRSISSYKTQNGKISHNSYLYYSKRSVASFVSEPYSHRCITLLLMWWYDWSHMHNLRERNDAVAVGPILLSSYGCDDAKIRLELYYTLLSTTTIVNALYVIAQLMFSTRPQLPFHDNFQTGI